MPYGISMHRVPTYCLSAFRHFLPQERHISRVDANDILIIMLDGVLRFTEDGASVELGRGEYYIQKKGLRQDGPDVSDSPTYFYLHFSEGEWTDMMPLLPHRGVCDPDSLLPLLRELDAAEGADAPSVVKSGLLCSLLTSLYRGQARTEREILVDRIATRLTEDLREPPTLAELASAFHFSENYIIRIFRETMGMTPHAYLTAARLRKAKLLLSTGNVTAERIADECGFSDYAHFYRMFRQVTGMTPREYRRGG